MARHVLYNKTGEECIVACTDTHGVIYLHPVIRKNKEIYKVTEEEITDITIKNWHEAEEPGNDEQK